MRFHRHTLRLASTRRCAEITWQGYVQLPGSPHTKISLYNSFRHVHFKHFHFLDCPVSTNLRFRSGDLPGRRSMGRWPEGSAQRPAQGRRGRGHQRRERRETFFPFFQFFPICDLAFILDWRVVSGF